MSVPSALRLREMRDKKRKPVKFKVEFTLKQLKAMSIGLETLILRGNMLQPDTIETAQEALSELKNRIRKFDELTPPDQRNFKPKRRMACAKCGTAPVRELGEVCDDCLGPEAA